MSKAFFRFLRGEINGFYLTNIHGILNKMVLDIQDFMYSFSQLQFSPDEMDATTMYNIGKFAGIYPLWLVTSNFYGILKLTESAIFEGEERSERGLLERSTDTFAFEHTSEDEYDTDINTLASEDKKSSLIGNENTIGYISSEEENVIDNRGNVKASKVLAEPPVGVAYSDFKGNKFLILEDADVKLRFSITQEMFYELFSNMQNIRYNGGSLQALCNIVSIICPSNFVQIVSFTKSPTSAVYRLLYKLNTDVAIDDKDQRVATLLYIIKMKFPFIYVEEQTPDEDNGDNNLTT